jgi:hypothetical protein
MSLSSLSGATTANGVNALVSPLTSLSVALPGLSRLKRKVSLSNLSDKTESNTPHELFMKNLKELREYLLSVGHKTRDAMMHIFNNSEQDLRTALNTIYWEGNSYQTVFYEYCSTIDNITNEDKHCIDLLLSLGADINKYTTRTGEPDDDPESANALLWAMTGGKLELVEFLASRGATDTTGQIGLMIGHHNNNIQQKIKNAFQAGISSRRQGGTRRRRKMNKRKKSINRRRK